MESECKVLLDATVHSVRRETIRVNPSSKQTTSLLVFILCLAAAASVVLVFHRHAKGHGQDEDSFGLRHTLRQIANVRAAIHLVGHYNSAVNSSAEWKDKVDQSHYQGGLELKNNQIVIPQNGLYFVYSQASFRVNCSSSDADDASLQPIVHVSHTVKRRSKSLGNKDLTILHSIRSVCQMKASSNPDEEGNWFSSVYMGAVFNLMKGDRLRTVMGEKMLQGLEDETGKTFFGVFAL
ncbi:tumor necrosis factor a (TNF superfamily, member 2) isoform X1 [Gasterosteus aculeatus]|uniref:Tumor necrosis factor n=1 Tax=Gasterosteus aculeatus aculeatus TaxID=481459 RepID=A0AAQ4RVI8_GASAC|nr:tumor necrosis factor a (TNF superfamily, member 2) [Gasterosteus aculeatus aculeatus]